MYVVVAGSLQMLALFYFLASFIPGDYKKESHNQIRKLLFEYGFCILLINGDEKTLSTRDQDIDLSDFFSFNCLTIVSILHNNSWLINSYTFTFSITLPYINGFSSISSVGVAEPNNL